MSRINSCWTAGAVVLNRKSTGLLCLLLWVVSVAGPVPAARAGDGFCVPGWSTEIGQPGVFADFDAPALLTSRVVDLDGAEVLVVGGTFNTIDNVNANFIARWDGAQWLPFGTGLNGTVRDLTVFDGQLIAVGAFTATADGSRTLNRVARWDGQSWQPFGSGVNGVVNGVEVYDAGNGPELVIGGQFTASGAASVRYAARWTGSSWQQIGGAIGAPVLAIRSFDGDLYASGFFFYPSSSTVPGGNYILRWDGSDWSPLGGGMNLRGTTLEVYDDGNGDALYVGGVFNKVFNGFNASGQGDPATETVAFNIAKWNGQQWSALGGGVNAGVTDLVAYDPGDAFGMSLFVVGDFSAVNFSQITSPYIARWDNGVWRPVPSGMNNTPETITPYFENASKREILYVGGRFTMVEGRVARRIARWGCLPVDRVWVSQSGGAYLDPTNWSEGDVPGSQRRAVFDEYLAEVPIDPIISVTLGNDWFSRALSVQTDTVRLNLNSSTLVLTESATGPDPSLAVGIYNAKSTPGAIATLELANDSVLPASLFASRVEIGFVPDSDGTLRLIGPDLGLQASGDMLIGEFGAGTVIAESGSQISYSGSLLLGGSGYGSLTARTGSSVNSLNDQNSIIVGRDAGSMGSLFITNPQSSLVHISGSAGSVLFGDAGTAEVEVRNGGFLRTTSLNQIRLANQPGSAASVLVTGTGSVWQASGQAITTGSGTSQISVENGGRINASSGVILLPGSTLSGNGVVDGNVSNIADVAPGLLGSALPAVGTLSVLGDYQQSGVPLGGGLQSSGRLAILVDQQSNASSLDVIGDVRLAGRLLVYFDEQLGAPTPSGFEGANVPILSATSNLTQSRFDLAVMPPLPQATSGQIQFLRPQYNFDSRGGFSIDLVLDSTASVGFSDPQEIGAPGGPVDAVLADVGGPNFGAPDGLPDLLLLARGSTPGSFGSVVVFINQGLATPGDPESWQGFITSPILQYSVGPDPTAISVGDLDGNGTIDFVVTNSGDGTMTIRRNDGFGGFAAGSLVVPVGQNPTDIKIVELNEVGRNTSPDLAVALAGDNAIAIFRNLGGEGFGWQGVTLETTLDLDRQPLKLAGFNIDNDKWNNIASANSDGTVSLFGNDGKALTPLFTLAGTTQPSTMFSEDLDGDGFSDIAIGGADGLAILRNNANGSFFPPAVIPSDGPVVSVAALDYDGDGDLDIAFVAQGSESSELQVYRSELSDAGSLVFTPAQPPQVTTEPLLLVGSDVNQSGEENIVTITEGSLRGQQGAQSQIVAWLADRSGTTPCPGDADDNLVVNLDDLNLVLSNFGTTGAQGDVNGDGIVNLDDLNEVLSNFGNTCAP